MKVVFIKEFNPDCVKRYYPGDVAEFTEQTARFLRDLGKVKIEGDPDPKKPPRYNRRDMRASR